MNANQLVPILGLGGDAVLACPDCGGFNVHPVRLACTSPGRRDGRVVIDRDGIAIDPRHPPSGRGVLIELEFVCENGHAFAYALRFHEGNTFIDRRTALPAGTIWRD